MAQTRLKNVGIELEVLYFGEAMDCIEVIDWIAGCLIC